MGGEEDGESDEKEESEHGGDKDPEGDEVAEAAGECATRSSAAPGCNRHWICTRSNRINTLTNFSQFA